MSFMNCVKAVGAFIVREIEIANAGAANCTYPNNEGWTFHPFPEQSAAVQQSYQQPSYIQQQPWFQQPSFAAQIPMQYRQAAFQYENSFAGPFTPYNNI